MLSEFVLEIRNPVGSVFVNCVFLDKEIYVLCRRPVTHAVAREPSQNLLVFVTATGPLIKSIMTTIGPLNVVKKLHNPVRHVSVGGIFSVITDFVRCWRPVAHAVARDPSQRLFVGIPVPGAIPLNRESGGPFVNPSEPGRALCVVKATLVSEPFVFPIGASPGMIINTVVTGNGFHFTLLVLFAFSFVFVLAPAF